MMAPGLAVLNMTAVTVMSGCFFHSQIKLNPLPPFVDFSDISKIASCLLKIAPTAI